MDVVLQFGSEGEDLEAAFNPCRGSVECFTELFEVAVELFSEVVDLASFFYGGEVGTFGVFVQAYDCGFAVVALNLDGGDVRPSEAAAGVQAAVAGDQPPSVGDAPHGDGVQESVLRYVVGQILQLGGVKFESAVLRVNRGDRVDGEWLQGLRWG